MKVRKLVISYIKLHNLRELAEKTYMILWTFTYYLFLLHVWGETQVFWDPNHKFSAKTAEKVQSYLGFVRDTYGIDYRVFVLNTKQRKLLDVAVNQFKRQKLGRATNGKGVLLLIDLRKKQARAEIGYALEPFLTDLEASRWLTDYLQPYFANGQLDAGLEASVEGLVNKIGPHLEELKTAYRIQGSGGAGAKQNLKKPPLSGSGSEVEKQLKQLMTPQKNPRQTQQLIFSMMAKGYYYRDIPVFDPQWQKAERPVMFTTQRLKKLAREHDKEFEVLIEENIAVTYYTKSKKLGPWFFYKNQKGWVADMSTVNKYIIYNYSNTGWYALDADYPYLNLLKKAFPMKPIILKSGKKAWVIK